MFTRKPIAKSLLYLQSLLGTYKCKYNRPLSLDIHLHKLLHIFLSYLAAKRIHDSYLYKSCFPTTYLSDSSHLTKRINHNWFRPPGAFSYLSHPEIKQDFQSSVRYGTGLNFTNIQHHQESHTIYIFYLRISINLQVYNCIIEPIFFVSSNNHRSFIQLLCSKNLHR